MHVMSTLYYTFHYLISKNSFKRTPSTAQVTLYTLIADISRMKSLLIIITYCVRQPAARCPLSVLRHVRLSVRLGLFRHTHSCWHVRDKWRWLNLSLSAGTRHVLQRDILLTQPSYCCCCCCSSPRWRVTMTTALCGDVRATRSAFDVHAPRYTSTSTCMTWSTSFLAANCLDSIQQSTSQTFTQPLVSSSVASRSIHLPCRLEAFTALRCSYYYRGHHSSECVRDAFTYC